MSWFDSLRKYKNGGSSGGGGGSISIPDASTSVKGIIQIATDEEVEKGTNENKAIVPKTLKKETDKINDAKLDKVNTANIIYGTDKEGKQKEYDVSDIGGISLWNATKSYKKDDVVKIINSSNKIILYYAKADNTNANPLTDNTGKWGILGNDFGDLTTNLTSNSFNANNGAFDNQHKLALKKLDDIYYISLKWTPTNPIIDLKSSKRKILELPSINDINEMVGYITTPIGKRTSEENRAYFYEGDGSIDINDFTPVCNVKSLIVNTDGYAVQKRNSQTHTHIYNGELPICEDTVVTLNATSDTTIYRLKNPLNLIGQDEHGNNLWETEAIEVRCNLNYMYAVAMHNNGCNVDSNGNMGHYEFVENEVSASVKTDLRPMAKYGFNGTYEFVIDQHESKTKEIPVYIYDSAIYIDGDIGVKDIVIRGNF